MLYRVLTTVFVAAALPLPALAQEQPNGAAGNPPPELSEQELAQRVSYALGRSIADDCRMGGIELDSRALNRGIEDAVEGNESPWSDEELGGVMRLFARRIQQRIAADNKQRGEAFLAENAKEPGVETTASGLQYKVLQEGDGPTPEADSVVVCHYRGTFVDGQPFDSSYGGAPAQFEVGGVIAGWTEALQMMKVGDKYQLFVPAELAYGEAGRPGIGPNETLIFEVELLDVIR